MKLARIVVEHSVVLHILITSVNGIFHMTIEYVQGPWQIHVTIHRVIGLFIYCRRNVDFRGFRYKINPFPIQHSNEFIGDI